MALKGVILFFDGMLPIGSTLEAYGPNLGSSLVKFHVFDRSSCADLTETELDIHEALGELGERLGLSMDEKVSLFDLPSMIHFGGLKNYYVKYFFRLLTPYTTCVRAGWNRTVINDRDTLKNWRDQLRDCAKVWGEYVMGNDSEAHPCIGQQTQQNPCCFNIMSLMEGDIKLLLTLMKHAYHLGSVQSITGDFIPFLNNSHNDRFESPFVSEKEMKSDGLEQQEDRLAMIPICSFTGKEKKETFQGRDGTNDCQLFQPIWTDKGVCQSFNSIAPEKMLADSEFKSLFKDVFERKNFIGNSLEPGISGGDNQGISFYLDRQSFLHGDEVME